jgi:hypothetical protein
MRALPIAALLLLAACANGGGLGQADTPPSIAAAQAASRDGSPQVALQIDDAILANDPRNLVALLNRGDAQTALHQPDPAAVSYTDALRADPHSALARIGLGRLRLADDPSAAEALFFEASQSDPHNAAAWNDLGIARDLLGRHEDAQAAYRQAIGLDASMRSAQVNLAMSLAIADRADDPTPAGRVSPRAPTPLTDPVAFPPPAQPAAVTPPPTQAVAVTPPLTPAVTQPRIVLSATADAWMQVRDKSGQVLLSRILHPGESWPVPAQPNLLLSTGNAGGTDILLDGVAISSLGPSGAVRRNIPLDAALLEARNLSPTSRPIATASTASPGAPSATPSIQSRTSDAAAATPRPAPPPAESASLSPAAPTLPRATDTTAPPEPAAAAPPTHTAATAPPALAVSHPRIVASATAAPVPRDDHRFLAAALSPGMRALTVGVDGVSGTADPIWPGDRVDLILTQETPGDGPLLGTRIASKLVLSEVRVIALDQQLVQRAAPGSSDKPAGTVTFEVDRDQAERVSAATRLGRLWLAPHSTDTARRSPDPHPADPTPWASEVVAVLGHDATPNPNHVVHVFPGAANSKEFHF